jgi:hypothetical protein
MCSAATRLGGAREHLVPVSGGALERLDETIEQGRDLVIVHRVTSVIVFLIFS